MTNTDLRPCPRCGGKAEQDDDAIFCPTCDCYLILEVYQDFEAAKSAWNYRPLEDALTARANRAEAEVARLNRMVERLIEAGNKLAESVADEWTFSDGKVHSDEWHDLVADWQSENEGR